MDTDLSVLGERLRKDPESYRAEYVAQQSHYVALLAAASLRPADASPRLPDVAAFVASAAPHFGPDASAAIAAPTVQLLSEAAPALQPAARRALVRTLALLRARGAADAKVVIPLFFRLLGCEDKLLRRMLHGSILADVKRMQASGDAGRRSLQAFLFAMVNEPNEVLVKRSLNVLVALFRKRVWNDARTANVIASCSFHESAPVAVIACKFLLDSESKDEEEDSDDNESDEELGADGLAKRHAKRGHDGRKASEMWKAFSMTGKKNTRKKKQMERTINRATRLRRAPGTNGLDSQQDQPSFAAMMLLNDPQSFAERLYTDLQTRRRNEPYENRLVLINLLTRLVGTHKLLVLNLYPFLQRYLQPAQPEVTRVLAYLAQGCHELVPPDVLHPVVRGLADNFVSERCSPPAMAAGINTIRAICVRVPLAVFDLENEDKPEDEQEAPLLEDLVQYKNNRDKGVVMAARGLISLFREVNPRLLHKRDRGRSAAEAVQKGTVGRAPAYGLTYFATGVEGAELLADNIDDQGHLIKEDDGDEVGDDGDEVGDDGDEVGDDGDEVGDDRDDIDCDDDTDNDDEVEILQGAEAGEAKIEVSGDENDDDEVDNREGEADGTIIDSKPGDQKAEEASEEKGVDHLRILTDDDFRRIRARAAARAVEGVPKGRHAGNNTVDTGDAVDPMDIQGVVKKERKNLEERLESVIAGREGREKFGSRKGLQKGGGSTNKSKRKTKANSMVIHKQRRKAKLSRRDKQLARHKKPVYK
jgi:protein SDA1